MMTEEDRHPHGPDGHFRKKTWRERASATFASLDVRETSLVHVLVFLIVLAFIAIGVLAVVHRAHRYQRDFSPSSHDNAHEHS